MPEQPVFVSPAEPAKMKTALTQAEVTWVSSVVPERYGVDFAWLDASDEWTGVQRKEVKDFLASVQDDRLGREIGQMRAAIGVPRVVIEGKVKFVRGELAGNGYGQKITKKQWAGMMFSLQQHGVHVLHSEDMRGTAEIVSMLCEWSGKKRHDSLMRRPGPVSPWGKAGNRDYAIHLVQGLPGVGVELAGRIVDRFGGVPWDWKEDVTVEVLTGIEGVGKVKAQKILDALR